MWVTWVRCVSGQHWYGNYVGDVGHFHVYIFFFAWVKILLYVSEIFFMRFNFFTWVFITKMFHNITAIATRVDKKVLYGFKPLLQLNDMRRVNMFIFAIIQAHVTLSEGFTIFIFYK